MQSNAVIKHVFSIAAGVGVVGAVAYAAADHGLAWKGVPIALACAALAVLVQWIAFVPSFLKRTEHYYDLVGTLTYLLVTWSAVAMAGRFEPRALLVSTLVTIWTTRLGIFLFRRVKRQGKDGRFDAIKQDAGRFLVAWTTQGVWVFVTACAAIAAITTAAPSEIGLLDGVGALVWLFGFAVETIADRQKSAFRAEHPDGFVNTGLWAWSRHPNYFGEIVLWIGVAIIAASTLTGWQWVTMVSPVFVLWLLTSVSGVPMLEKRADARWGERTDYQDYKARTSVLVPWPPKASRSTG